MMRPEEVIPAGLSGQIEKITYCDEDNGFTIERVKVCGQRDLVTVIGNRNARLQEAFNPGKDEAIRGGRNFRINDKVMQICNNYEKEVFRVDIGKITDIDADDPSPIVSFDGRQIPYDFADLDEIVLAYTISVHKSQGSEYPAVVMPILPQHYMLLQRNLIYTEVTRGRKLVVLVSAPKALAIGLGNDRTQKRFTCLKNRLKGEGYEKQLD